MSRSRIIAGVGIGITAGLLWWTLRDVSLSEVLIQIRKADPLLLGAAVVTATFSFLLRALRWRVLLMPRFDGTSLQARFGATCIGFMANNVFPARIGEFARAYALTRTTEVPLGPSLASLVVERMFDGVVLALLLFGTMALPGFPGLSEGGEIIRRSGAVGAGVFAVALCVLWLVARHPAPTLKVFEHTAGRMLTPHITDRAIAALSSFIDGLGVLHRPLVFLLTLGWTLIVWLCLAASLWLALLALGITGPGFPGAVFLQAVIAFAVAIPSTPGFFGVFEAASRVGLGVYGVPAVSTVSFATSYHLLTFLPVTLLGVWYVHRFGMVWGEMRRGEEIVEIDLGGEVAANSPDPTAAIDEAAAANPADAGKAP